VHPVALRDQVIPTITGLSVFFWGGPHVKKINSKKFAKIVRARSILDGVGNANAKVLALRGEGDSQW